MPHLRAGEPRPDDRRPSDDDLARSCATQRVDLDDSPRRASSRSPASRSGSACPPRRSSRCTTSTRTDRPQPRLDRDRERGMAVSVGRLRPCPILDFRMVALVHNTIRGAAGAAMLNAELLEAQGIAVRCDADAKLQGSASCRRADRICTLHLHRSAGGAVIVIKFGGTSVGDADRVANAIDIVAERRQLRADRRRLGAGGRDERSRRGERGGARAGAGARRRDHRARPAASRRRRHAARAAEVRLLRVVHQAARQADRGDPHDPPRHRAPRRDHAARKRQGRRRSARSSRRCSSPTR